jgi:acyl-CoA synthetase (AMP-forming)/AMP-acid ligase II
MYSDFERIEPAARRARVEAEPLPPTIDALLDFAVERYGGKLGWHFFDDGIAMTWREIQAAVARAANALASLGIGKGSHVGVQLPNVAEFPITWLALARLGAVMVPINVAYTTRELDYILRDSDAEYLVIHAELRPAFDTLDPKPVPASRVVVVGARQRDFPHHWPALLADAAPVFTRRAAASADDLMNIQYTSGTTGFPKGCMLPHRYWVTIGKACASVFATPIERVYGGFNLFYMVVQRMLMHSMFQGSTLYVPRKPSIRHFMEHVRATRADFCAVYESSVYKQPSHPDDGTNALRIVHSIGLNKAYHADFERRFDVRTQEIYGMTETGLVLYMPVHEIERMLGSGSCGVVAPFVRTVIADEDGRPVPQGQPGELWVKGPGLLHGYYKKPEANAESFRDGWFRTGDQFREDSRGFHTILGRFKDMIRRGGENIAAREVEAVLRMMPEVQDAAVIPVADDDRGEEVKAYVALMPGRSRADLPPERVFAHCASHLAPFKVPRYLEYRDALPRTESGRVEKKKLIAETADLRAGSYDRRDKVWR